MTRIISKLVVALVGLFVLPLFAIRAQPYDDSQLRALLTSDSCPIMNCFIGIHPGVTTIPEALAILEGHEWVDTVRQQVWTEGLNWARWDWNGLQPDILWHDVDEETTDTGYVVLRDELVTRIGISTTIPLGRIWLLLKPTTISGNLVHNSEQSAVSYTVQYIENGLSFDISISLTCPVNYTTFWQAPVRFVISTRLSTRPTVPPEELIKSC